MGRHAIPPRSTDLPPVNTLRQPRARLSPPRSQRERGMRAQASNPASCKRWDTTTPNILRATRFCPTAAVAASSSDSNSNITVGPYFPSYRRRTEIAERRGRSCPRAVRRLRRASLLRPARLHSQLLARIGVKPGPPTTRHSILDHLLMQSWCVAVPLIPYARPPALAIHAGCNVRAFTMQPRLRSSLARTGRSQPPPEDLTPNIGPPSHTFAVHT